MEPASPASWKVDRTDLPLIIFGAVGGFLIPVIALGADAGLITGLLAGAPSGTLGGILVCMVRKAGKRN